MLFIHVHTVITFYNKYAHINTNMFNKAFYHPQNHLFLNIDAILLIV